MKIDGLLDDIRDWCLVTVDEHAVALEQDFLHQVFQIIFRLNDLLSDDLCSNRTNIVQVGIPHLEGGLSLEPSLVDEQAVYNARAIVLASSFLGCLDDFGRYDSGVRLGDELFFELAGDALDDEVAQAEGDLGDFVGGDGGGDAFVVVDWED